MKTKCPHCGSEESIDSTQKRRFYSCGSYQTQGFDLHRSDLCIEREEVNRLIEGLKAWKAAAIELRSVVLLSDSEAWLKTKAVALYEAAAEKYGL